MADKWRSSTALVAVSTRTTYRSADNACKRRTEVGIPAPGEGRRRSNLERRGALARRAHAIDERIQQPQLDKSCYCSVARARRSRERAEPRLRQPARVAMGRGGSVLKRLPPYGTAC